MTVSSGRGDALTPNLHLVAWEITRNCNLFCAHCRASAGRQHYQDGLSTRECHGVIDQIIEVGRPIIILSGGEPLARQDVFSLAEYATGKGLRVVMGTNGTLITRDVAAKLKAVHISRVGISLDFPLAQLQDDFRGQAGAFAAALDGIANAREAGIEVQVNSTVTRLNVKYLDRLLELALKVGAVAFHPFMLVPTGRGRGLASVELAPEEYEATLNWICDKQTELGDRIFFKPTDAPHYLRIVRQRQKQQCLRSAPEPMGGRPADSITRGCLAGTGFAFVSYQGKVKGCGYLDVEAGDLKRQSFGQVWSDSPLFNRLRDLSGIKGKCGVCEFKSICGGCRARAFETTGDYLEAEPYCVYRPARLRRALTGAQG